MAFIPKSYLDGLILIPKDVPVGIVMRHAERFEIQHGDVGFDIPLTEDGRKTAFELGLKHLKDKNLNIYSSTVGRCVETGEQILKGANNNSKVMETKVLFGDKIFVNDFPKMANFYMKNGMLTLLDLAFNRKEITGLNRVDAAVYSFLDFILERIDSKDGISLFITHDMFISLIVGELFRHKTTGENWPEFMEPIFIWRDGNNIKLYFRGNMKNVSFACVAG